MKWRRVGGLLPAEKKTLRCGEQVGQVGGGVASEHAGHDLVTNIEHRLTPGEDGYGEEDDRDACSAAERSSVKVLADSNLELQNEDVVRRLEGALAQQDKMPTKMQCVSASLENQCTKSIDFGICSAIQRQNEKERLSPLR